LWCSCCTCSGEHNDWTRARLYRLYAFAITIIAYSSWRWVPTSWAHTSVTY
jgi:hypothetical protein